MKARIVFLFSRVPEWFARDIIIPFIITRLALALVAWFGFHLLPLPVTFPSSWEVGLDGSRHALMNHISPTLHPWVNMWSRWDAGWFVDIAKTGYQYQPGFPSNAAFFPLYPLLMRAIHALLFLPASDYWWLVTGIVVSNMALLVGLGYFRALVAIDFQTGVASRAVTYLLIFPTTFFLSGVYTESLFLTLTVAAFYYARNNRWLLACVLASLGALTRSQGIVLAVPLLLEYFSQRSFNPRKIRWNIAAFALIPAALFVFAFFLKLKFGRWSVMFDVQRPWGRYMMWPWGGSPLVLSTRTAVKRGTSRYSRLLAFWCCCRSQA